MIRIRRCTGDEAALPRDLHPVLRQVLANRDVRDPADLALGLDGLHPFHHLHGLDRAVGLLVEAVTGGWPILVVGDFDTAI